MEGKQTKIRSLIWNLCFYGGCFFCVFYLKNKIEIKNFDVIFVFLPLIFLAFSTECFKIKNFKVLTLLDFVWICIAFLFGCFAFSVISSIIIFCKEKGKLPSAKKWIFCWRIALHTNAFPLSLVLLNFSAKF